LLGSVRIGMSTCGLIRLASLIRIGFAGHAAKPPDVLGAGPVRGIRFPRQLC
jgi:hypothetical protein